MTLDEQTLHAPREAAASDLEDFAGGQLGAILFVILAIVEIIRIIISW